MASKLTIIDYGLGNLASVANALGKLGISFEISDDPSTVEQASALLLPGVGPAGQGMQNLKELKLDPAIRSAVRSGKPILGICLGMQLLMDNSEEDNTRCLGLISGSVERFKTSLKVPQMGWNQVAASDDSKLLKNLPNDSYFYFVHSYYCLPDDLNIVKGTTIYDSNFCSVVEQGNVFGTQFHPEKSGDAGLQLLCNFWEAVC